MEYCEQCTLHIRTVNYCLETWSTVNSVQSISALSKKFWKLGGREMPGVYSSSYKKRRKNTSFLYVKLFFLGGGLVKIQIT